MKDIRVTVTLKNNILISKREELGFNQEKMAQFLGIRLDVYRKFENLMAHPNDDKYWDEANQMAMILECSLKNIFPENLTKIKLNKKTLEIDSFKLEQLYYKPKQILAIESKEFKKELHKAMEVLTPREVEVLEKRFGLNDEEEKTFEEIGKESIKTNGHGKIIGIGVGKDRIRQIELKALRKLRHPINSKKLRPYYKESEDS